MPLITFEGINGVGKTAAMKAVQQWWQSTHASLSATWTSEPYSTAIRALSASPNLDPIAQASLLIADRVCHCSAVVSPALERGEWVFCDRYLDSTIAYQGYGRSPGSEWTLNQIQDAYRLGANPPIPTPDITILLIGDPAKCLARARASKGQDLRMEFMDLESQERVASGYEKLTANDYRHRFIRIDTRNYDSIPDPASAQAAVADRVIRELGFKIWSIGLDKSPIQCPTPIFSESPAD